MQSGQHVPESQRNVSNILQNPCHASVSSKATGRMKLHQFQHIMLQTLLLFISFLISSTSLGSLWVLLIVQTCWSNQVFIPYPNTQMHTQRATEKEEEVILFEYGNSNTLKEDIHSVVLCCSHARCRVPQ